MTVEPSSNVEWQLIVSGKTVYTSTNIVDCIEKRETYDDARVVSTGPKES